MNKKITSDEIRAIEAGESMKFTFQNIHDLFVAQSLAYRLNKYDREKKKRYSCKSDFDKLEITITANSIE